MRERQGIPEEALAREVWIALAEGKRNLGPVQQAEFASYLLCCVVDSFEDEETWAAEDAESQMALACALEILKEAGW